jgi:hypothetical protein
MRLNSFFSRHSLQIAPMKCSRQPPVPACAGGCRYILIALIIPTISTCPCSSCSLSRLVLVQFRPCHSDEMPGTPTFSRCSAKLIGQHGPHLETSSNMRTTVTVNASRERVENNPSASYILMYASPQRALSCCWRTAKYAGCEFLCNGQFPFTLTSSSVRALMSCLPH